MLVGGVHGLWEFAGWARRLGQGLHGLGLLCALGVVARLELMLGCCCGSNNHDCRHCLLRWHGFASFSSRTFMRYVLIGVGLLSPTFSRVIVGVRGGLQLFPSSDVVSYQR